MQRGSFSLLHIKATSSVGQASRDCDSPFWMAPHAGECLAQSGFALADREVRCDRSLEGWWLALSNRKSHPAPGKERAVGHGNVSPGSEESLRWWPVLVFPAYPSNLLFHLFVSTSACVSTVISLSPNSGTFFFFF